MRYKCCNIGMGENALWSQELRHLESSDPLGMAMRCLRTIQHRR
nr:MAG TPA: hypothetical protein [Caudoviricetes sp.]